MDKMSIGIIGCGNMGSMIAKGLINNNIISKRSLLVNDKVSAKASALSRETGCVAASLDKLVAGTRYILLCMKPQDMPVFFGPEKPCFNNRILISIMAGVKIRDLKARAGSKCDIFRAMPNMAAAVSESATCLAYGKGASVSVIKRVNKILSSIGKVITVKEKAMDAVTAVSGSGPAYLFFLAEAMEKAAEVAGLDKKISRELIAQTLYGSAKYFRYNAEDPGVLISRVASKRGTTEAALGVLKKKRVKTYFVEAVKKAKNRSEELSGGK